MAQKISSLTGQQVDVTLFSEIELTESETAAALEQALIDRRREEKNKDYELSDFDRQYALMLMRGKKRGQLNMMAYKARLMEKPVEVKIEYPTFTAEELQEKIIADGLIVDEWNKEIVWQMCLYFTADKRCVYDLEKGLCLLGGPGVGKSHLMQIFSYNQSNSFTIVTCRQVTYDYQKDGDAAIVKYSGNTVSMDIKATYGQRFIGTCFDDLGTEKDKQFFGNKSNVMEEVLSNRYDYKMPRQKTHITSNLFGDEVEERYGYRLRSRFREMFNMITFDENAPDRRK